jgi:hypothetical protein
MVTESNVYGSYIQCLRSHSGELLMPNAHAQRRAGQPLQTFDWVDDVRTAAVPPVRCSTWLGAVPLLRPTPNAPTIAVPDHPTTRSHG